MVAVHALQHFHRHAEEARDLPEVATVLHRPRRRRLPQDVRGDVLLNSAPHDGGRERLTHGANGLAVPLDNRMFGDAEPVPTPQVCKQSVRQAHRRLTLFGFACTLRPPVKDTAIQIDMAAPDGGLNAAPQIAAWRVPVYSPVRMNLAKCLPTSRLVCVPCITCFARHAAHSSRAA